MRARAIGRTSRGRHRDSNEDALLVDDEIGLYVVCDGVGGHAAGEVASATAIEAVRRVVTARTDDLQTVRSGTDGHHVLYGIAEKAVDDACRAVYKQARSEPGQAGMACTLSGSGGLDGSLDFTLDVDLPLSRLKAVGGAGLEGALASVLGGGNSVLPLSVRIRGTSANPAVTGGGL